VYPPTDIVQIGLRWSRQALAARVEARVHQMVADGLVDEVRSLAAPGALSHTARQALGYKEILDHLEGRCTLADAIATTIVRTRQFAVRQERWFRRDPRIAWVDVTADPLEALPVVVQALAS
jgi:tRNA dimethylallyltransferase